MPTLFHHEIESFRTELTLIKSRYQEIAKPGAVENLTHASFGVSNRENQMVVGLCSLVEVSLLDRTKGTASPIKLSDVRGQGITRLKLFLSRLGIVDFSSLKNWAHFKSVYQLRNAIVHSYGGMIVDEPNEKLIEHLSKLGLANVLVGGRRIRLGPNALETILNIVDSLLRELGAYENQPT
jgi:hypothetical protein